MRRINIDIKNMMPLFLKFVENPTLALTPEESRSMRGMIAQIERETRGRRPISRSTSSAD